ncbi:MAG: hypothetical protein IJX31_04610 [Clostridia bacterium]|nr:hypothetical protein [Clostridia bacterium]
MIGKQLKRLRIWTDEELAVELEQAKRNGDTRRAQRIIAELKKRGKRNTKKQRGGPHMRLFWLLLLLKRIIEGDEHENPLFIGTK